MGRCGDNFMIRPMDWIEIYNAQNRPESVLAVKINDDTVTPTMMLKMVYVYCQCAAAEGQDSLITVTSHR